MYRAVRQHHPAADYGGGSFRNRFHGDVFKRDGSAVLLTQPRHTDLHATPWNWLSRVYFWRKLMQDHTYKVIELVGSSTIGSDDAIRQAIAKASQTLRHMRWFEVVETRGHIEDGNVAHFQVTLKAGFQLD
jgi:flavin-binding protein dodecin